MTYPHDGGQQPPHNFTPRAMPAMPRAVLLLPTRDAQYTRKIWLPPVVIETARHVIAAGPLTAERAIELASQATQQQVSLRSLLTLQERAHLLRVRDLLAPSATYKDALAVIQLVARTPTPSRAR